MKSPFGLGLVAVMTTASLAMAQANGAGGNGGTPTTDTSEASLFPAGTVDMAPGEGITFDLGDEFMLNMFNLLQFSWTYESLENSPSRQNFDMQRARTFLRGHAFDPSIEFLLSMEWTDPDGTTRSPNVLKDGWVQWRFWENEENSLALRAGQSKTGFGRQGTMFEGGYELPGSGRQVATRTFAALRSQGAWVGGKHVDDQLSWHAGVQNGDVSDHATGVLEYGEETANPDNEISFLAVARFDTAEDLGGEWGREADLMSRENVDWGVGAGVLVGNNRDATNTFDVESTVVNVNGVLKTQGVAVSGEWFTRSDDPDVSGGVEEDSDGWQLQGSYTTAPASTQYGVVAGVSGVTLDPGAVANTVSYVTATDLGTTSGDILEWLIGVNLYYHEHNMKTQVAYVYQDIDPDGASSDSTNDIILVTLQLIF